MGIFVQGDFGTLEIETLLWIRVQSDARLRKAVSRRFGRGIERERLGEIAARRFRVAVLKMEHRKVHVCGRIARVRAERSLKRRLRAVPAAERGTRGAEQVLGARVLGMRVDHRLYGGQCFVGARTVSDARRRPRRQELRRLVRLRAGRPE